MTYEARGFIRNYDPSTDTASVELVGVGVIDTWISGLKVHIGVSRGALANGIPCVVSMPDQHRICEAVITHLGDPATGSSQTIVNGRDEVAYGSATVISFGHTFSNPPTVTASTDLKSPCTISAVTTTTFTVNPGSGSGNVWVSWTAQGT